MPASLFASCTESCGWVAAIAAVMSWGSFGVPIKTGVNVEVNPLVMQSFKTTVCFATCWGVVLLGEEVRWSSWGIVSGMFWVPGATCGIYGIRNAGLAVAVGTWSSINVLASFFFGLVIFQEGVKNFFAASLAFLCLIVGLIGMAKYSAPQAGESGGSTTARRPSDGASGRGTRRSSIRDAINDGTSTGSIGVKSSSIAPLEIEFEPLVNEGDDEAMIMGGAIKKPLTDGASSGSGVDPDKDRASKDHVVLFHGRISLTRRQMGVLGAVINGAWGGMSLIPLHFALREDGLTGAGYVISFAGGSVIVNIVLWILYYLYYLYHKKGQWKEAWECLPNWHLDHLLIPGIMAGTLYSAGNFASILAVTYLGQGTGYSFCQMQLFVSGLWGVFYFREIKGFQTISKWFASAAVAVVGIIWLSYEHESKAVGHRR